MNAVIYARYSSDNQREESIEGQIRECTAYAVKHGYTVLRHYIDRALSAKTDNRPEFQEMIKDSSKKLFDTVIVWKLDRFARNRYDSARHKATLKKNGVKVISAMEAIADGSIGIMMETILEGMAEYYSVDLAEKVVRGLTENALKCKFNGGNLPVGYTIDSERRYQINPLTAPFVVEAFQMYLDGAKIIEIRDYLNSHRVTTAKGTPITFNSVQHMLHNRRYIGEYAYREVVVPDGMPAIISQELFDRVQEKLEKNRKAPARHCATEYYLLTTKLFCGHCGAYMCGESGTGSKGTVHHYYKCVSVKKKRQPCHKRSVRKKWIEDLVIDKIVKFIMDDSMIEAIINTMMDSQDQGNIRLPLYEQQLRETEAGIQNLLNAIQQGVLTTSTKQRLDELEAAQEDLKTKIALEKLKQPLLTREKLEYWLLHFRHVDTKDPVHRKALVDTFVNAIYLYDDKMLLTFNCSETTSIVNFGDVKAFLAKKETHSDMNCEAVPKNKREQKLPLIFLRKGLERSNCNMPVAYCCHQFKNWWLPIFLSETEMQTSPFRRTKKEERAIALSSFLLHRGTRKGGTSGYTGAKIESWRAIFCPWESP